MIRGPRTGRDTEALAELISGWLARLPRWDLGPPEAWAPFLTRYAAAEVDLASRLRQLPGCDIDRGARGGDVHMSLAGVSVHSGAGVPTTCRLWIAAARSRNRI